MESSSATIGKDLYERLVEYQGASDTKKQDARKRALQAARDVVRALETPEEQVMRYAYEMGSQRLAIRCGVDLKIFKIIAERNGKPINSQELASACKAEKLLVVRIMRSLISIGFVAESDIETYVANPVTRALATPALTGGVIATHDLSARVQMTMHEYFRDVGWQCPTDSKDCALQWTFKTSDDYFTLLHKNPETTVAFNDFMTKIRSTRRHWTEWFLMDEQIFNGQKQGPDEVLLIDVGGGKGHDLEVFHKRYPDVQGRLILQDLAVVLDDIEELSTKIQPMVYDFFTPQPIKGARAYFTHFVLHDWPDEDCRRILRSLIPALEAGYSKILLNENVLPDRNCPTWSAAMDMNMMAIAGGMERSKSHWIALVESVGLKVTHVWTSPFEGDTEGVIEAYLP